MYQTSSGLTLLANDPQWHQVPFWKLSYLSRVHAWTDQTAHAKPTHPIPKRRWQLVSTDLFSVKKDTFVIVVDNLIKCWDIEEMSELVLRTLFCRLRRSFPGMASSQTTGPNIPAASTRSSHKNGISSTILHHDTIRKEMEQQRQL